MTIDLTLGNSLIEKYDCLINRWYRIDFVLLPNVQWKGWLENVGGFHDHRGDWYVVRLIGGCGPRDALLFVPIMCYVLSLEKKLTTRETARYYQDVW